MTSYRFLKFLAIAAIGFTLSALAKIQAQTTFIYIVASNGDRTATQTALSNILSKTAGGPNGTGWYFRGSSGAASAASGSVTGLSNATASNFGAWNGQYGSGPTAKNVVVKVTYSGALAGIEAVAGDTNQKFVASNGLPGDLPQNAGPPVTPGNLPSPIAAATGSEFIQVAKATFGFSTNFQTTSPFQEGVVIGDPPNQVTYAGLVEENVGVSPLGFYASPGFPGSPSSTRPSFKPNITTQIAQILYTSGAVPLALFTGDYTVPTPETPNGTNDINKIVYAIGRNTDAGQRFGAYAEIGLGLTSAVSVYFPTFATPSDQIAGANGITYGGTVVSQVLWPASQQPGVIPVGEGSGGYNGGAALAPVLTATLTENAYRRRYILAPGPVYGYDFPNAVAGYYIGYLTPGDADPRVLGSTGVVPLANRGVALSYNGVELTSENVRNGRYTAWIYNRLIRPKAGAVNELDAFETLFADALRDRIRSVDAEPSGIFNNDDFKVYRSTDGGFVLPK